VFSLLTEAGRRDRERVRGKNGWESSSIECKTVDESTIKSRRSQIKGEGKVKLEVEVAMTEQCPQVRGIKLTTVPLATLLTKFTSPCPTSPSQLQKHTTKVRSRKSTTVEKRIKTRKYVHQENRVGERSKSTYICATRNRVGECPVINISLRAHQKPSCNSFLTVLGHPLAPSQYRGAPRHRLGGECGLPRGSRRF